jgi:UDP-glucose-4-epimerase GalE
VKDVDAVRAALRAYDVDAVLHFAGWLSVGDSVFDPIGYYRNNVRGTLAVLEAMVTESVSRFVFSSTAATYGEPIEAPITEAHPTVPINPYGQTKLAIEQALPHFERAYGLRSIALRYFNAAGADPDGELGEEHEPEIHLIPRAIDAVRGGLPLRVFGTDYATPDGTCLRDFVHVTDLAGAHLLALEALEGGARSTMYNLGNGRPHSVRDVIATVERVAGRAVPWEAAPRRAGDPAVLYASNGKIQHELGWQPHCADLGTIVETAWRWRESHPHGFTPDGAR